MPREMTVRTRVIDENDIAPIPITELAEILEMRTDDIDDIVLDEQDARPLTYTQIAEAMSPDIVDPTDIDPNGSDLNEEEYTMFYRNYAERISEEELERMMNAIDNGSDDPSIPDDYEGDITLEEILAMLSEDTREGAHD